MISKAVVVVLAAVLAVAAAAPSLRGGVSLDNGPLVQRACIHLRAVSVVEGTLKGFAQCGWTQLLTHDDDNKVIIQCEFGASATKSTLATSAFYVGTTPSNIWVSKYEFNGSKQGKFQTPIAKFFLQGLNVHDMDSSTFENVSWENPHPKFDNMVWELPVDMIEVKVEGAAYCTPEESDLVVDDATLLAM